MRVSSEATARTIITSNSAKILADSSNKDIGKLYVVKLILRALDGEDASGIKDGRVIVAVPIKEYSEEFENKENKTNETDTRKVIGAVFIEDQSTTLEEITSSISSNFIWSIIIIILMVIIASYLLTGFITGPVKGMLKAVDRMAEGKFDEKIKVRGHDEISELQMAFNTMSGKLQKTDAARAEFVSNVSHELKTPLSSMKVLIESLLLQDNVPEEMYKEFLGDTNSEIDRLTDIVNHLLSLVKMDVKVLPLKLEEVSLNEMVQNIIKRLLPLADKKGLLLNLNEEKDDILMECDKINITLAISNLIENGIKYTDEGSVSVTIDSDHQNAYVTIKDTGIGMEEEDTKKIFDRFYRVDKTRARETGGTGLGLAITHRAIILHGGSIKVSSEVGVGTTFVVRIPLKQAKQN